jgi:RNA polymerase sigma factor (sigma-70 family)
LLSADEEAQFWTFYRKTSEALFRKAYRMCRGHQADADDAHQRAYLKALEHWPIVSVLADQKRNAWLATTLTREVLQIWRAPYRSRETGSHDDAGQPLAAPVGADSPDAVFAADRYHKACHGIARLEGRQRDVIALHCLAGYGISEVAEMLGISSSTTRVHLHTGRRRLLEIMAGEEDPPDGKV